jgi:hypothetical protein
MMGEFPRSMLVADVTELVQAAASTRTTRQVLEWKNIMALLGELEMIWA